MDLFGFFRIKGIIGPCGRFTASVTSLCFCRDVFCGKLFCEGGQKNPNYGRMVSFGKCKAAFFGDHTKDYGQVDAGTKCGDGKVRAPTDF